MQGMRCAHVIHSRRQVWAKVSQQWSMKVRRQQLVCVCQDPVQAGTAQDPTLDHTTSADPSTFPGNVCKPTLVLRATNCCEWSTDSDIYQ